MKDVEWVYNIICVECDTSIEKCECLLPESGHYLIIGEPHPDGSYRDDCLCCAPIREAENNDEDSPNPCGTCLPCRLEVKMEEIGLTESMEYHYDSCRNGVEVADLVGDIIAMMIEFGIPRDDDFQLI